MIGLIVGDALGVPVEFLSREEIASRKQGKVIGMEGYGTFNMPEGTWSDDSSMALATLASINEKKDIDPEDIMERFVVWVEDGAYTPFGQAFDIGRTCNEAILEYAMNRDSSKCGVTGEYANGNGALMRILPACVYWCERQDAAAEDITGQAVESIEMVGALTHNHKRSCIACGIYYFLVKNIINGANADVKTLIQKGMDEAFAYYGRDKSCLDELENYDELLDVEVLSEYGEDEIKGSGYVVDSFMAAVWSLVTTASYSECVLRAVNLGEDTDTTAAIAGGLAGLFYGEDNIPAEWINDIKGKEIINEYLV